VLCISSRLVRTKKKVRSSETRERERIVRPSKAVFRRPPSCSFVVDSTLLMPFGDEFGFVLAQREWIVIRTDPFEQKHGNRFESIQSTQI
jgi:hypothetical protein